MSLNVDKTTYATDSRFEPLRNAGVSYEDFSANQMYYIQKLSQSSIMSLAKNNTELQALLNMGTPGNSIFTERSAEADKRKAEAEVAYYTALDAEKAAGAEKDAAYIKYQKAMNSVDNGGSQLDFEKARNAYAAAQSSELAAESTRETMGYMWVDASKNAANAFAASVFADKQFKA